jgi:predicted DNA-binding transcriptional regulator AlpA
MLDLLTTADLADELGVNEDTIRRLVRRKRLPRPIRLTNKLHVWRAGDVRARLAELARE